MVYVSSTYLMHFVHLLDAFCYHGVVENRTFLAGKKLKKSVRDLSSDDSSDGKGRAKCKSRVKDKKKRERRYSSSDSYSSDESDFRLFF